MATHDVTHLLAQLGGGNRQALDALMPLVYAELRRIARRQLASERAGHTLDSVALVNEAFARLVNQRNLTPQNRAHFFGTAAGAMRRILVDYARARRAAKRGAGAAVVPLEGLTSVLSDVGAEGLLDLHDALGRLTEIDAAAGRVVEYQYFGGMTHPEIALALGTSVSTVRRRWRFARAWLARELGEGTDAGGLDDDPDGRDAP
jgi:RNA polymerase sigma factor (TIGR02999 family)